MSILVTGGAGYIGSHCVAALVEAGEDVIVYDDFSAGHRAALPGGVRIVEGRVQDEPRLREALAGADAVMHFAARADVPDSVRDPLDYFDVNVAGAVSLLRAMRGAAVSRLVFSSSASVYGNPLRVPIGEDDAKVTTHPYGATKWMTEQMIAACAAAYSLRAVSLRYFCAAGSDGVRGEDHAPERHLIPRVLAVALGRAAHAEICGGDYATPDGSGVRDFIHVSDLARAHLAALRYLRAGGESTALNVGTGRGWSVREVIAAARRVTGHAIPAVEAPRRAGDPPSLIADASRIGVVLGWSAQVTDIDDVVRSAWRWMQAHPEGWGQESAGHDRVDVE